MEESHLRPHAPTPPRPHAPTPPRPHAPGPATPPGVSSRVPHLPRSARGVFSHPRPHRGIVRLLYVSHSFPPPGRPLDNVGGMQRVATELHAALEVLPDVRLSSLLLRSSWRWTHLRMAPFGVRLLREIPRRVRDEGIDAVLFSSMVTAALALPRRGALQRLGVVTAAIPVGRDVTLPVGPYQRLVPRVFDSLDRIFPISRATAEECLRRGAPPERVRVVPCGVDPTRFPTPEDRGAARRELARAFPGDPLPDDALLLCSVGRHMERKGFAWFVDRVMPRLPPRVHFWLAGEGPTTPAVREAVARHGLGDRVRLLGRISDEELGVLLRGADLFAMPNIPVLGDIEGFGVVMLEAGMSGLPVIAAGIEGILDVVREGENGHLLPTRDAAAFAERIRAYDADRAALAAASARALRYTAATFTWPAIGRRYVELLREAVAERRGGA
jgi:phosphatidyl-myo-inositol dimannoside synthase